MSNAIALEIANLPPHTRDWIIARSAKEGVSPQRLLELVADQSAAKDGFKPGVGVELATAFHSDTEKTANR